MFKFTAVHPGPAVHPLDHEIFYFHRGGGNPVFSDAYLDSGSPLRCGRNDVFSCRVNILFSAPSCVLYGDIFSKHRSPNAQRLVSIFLHSAELR